MDNRLSPRATLAKRTRIDGPRSTRPTDAPTPRARIRTLLLQALLVVTLAAALAACGTTAKAQSAQGGSSGAVASIDACSLVTRAEAAALLGTPVGEPKSEAIQGLATTCNYLAEAPRDLRSVFIWVSPRQNADSARKFFGSAKGAAPSAGTTARDQAGLGDDAFWIDRQLWVLKGNVVLQFTADNATNTQKLASQALARLP